MLIESFSLPAQQASVTSSPDAIADYSYMRSTLNAVPSTNSLLKSSKLPLGLVITPYRSLKEGDVSFPSFPTDFFGKTLN